MACSAGDEKIGAFPEMPLRASSLLFILYYPSSHSLRRRQGLVLFLSSFLSFCNSK